MTAIGDAHIDDSAIRFPSLTSLRAAHTELLKRYRNEDSGVDSGPESGSGTSSAAALNEVVDFIRRGVATGALLDADSDRWSAQSVLDYWSTTAFRAGRSVADSSLAEFDPELAPTLDDALCPYVGLDAFREADNNLFFG